jgi:hypothetical protein
MPISSAPGAVHAAQLRCSLIDLIHPQLTAAEDAIRLVQETHALRKLARGPLPSTICNMRRESGLIWRKRIAHFATNI